MSDLHRAVKAEIQAFTPDRTPPFSALKERKRCRDRRRYAVAGAALSVVAVSAIAFGSVLPGGPQDTTTSVAGGSPTTGSVQPVVFDVLPVTLAIVDDSRFGVGADACVRLPGTSDLAEFTSTPAKYQVTVTGADAMAAFRSCVDQVVGYTAVVATEIVPQPPLPAPTDATGVRICVNLPDTGCAQAAPEVARGLAVSLLDAEPLPPDTVFCAALGRTYTLTFQVGSKELPEIRVPMICGAVEADGKSYTLPQSVLDQVEQAYRTAKDRVLEQQPAGSAGCIGTVTATTQNGKQVTLNPDAPATLTIAVGDRINVAGDGTCGDAVVAGSGDLDGLDGEPTSPLVAQQPGRYVLQVTHAMCAEVRDPACRGGVAFDGALILEVVE